ncbi:MAG: DUF4037 domain-containing protein [Defluviitaleaceae bacterium]|nr:DUF4037 domain-containing protein [Defluviitaleaceae bacterium]
MNGELTAAERDAVFRETCLRADLERNHWGGWWDDCILKSGRPMEINYQTLASARENLQNHLRRFIPLGGFTTCVCNIVFGAKILHDPHELFSDMRREFAGEYPEELRRNIIRTNRELLNGITPSYLKQLETAVKRDDIFKLNHVRVSFAASYFDIIFALNRRFHPGEKKLIEICLQTCKILPRDFERNLRMFFVMQGEDLLRVAREIIAALEEIEERW